MKILDFAIDVEQAEQDLYRRLATCSRDRLLQSVFEMIASKENVLLNKLRQLKEDPENGALELAQRPQLGAELHRTQSGSCDLLDEHNISSDLNGYSYVLRTEQMIFNLYLKLMNREKDPQARALLDLILQEKRQEIERIHAVYDVARIVH